MRRAAIVFVLATACDRETPRPAEAPPAEPATAVAAAPAEPAPAAIAAPPAAPAEPQPHGFAIVRPGATVHLRADDSVPPVKLAASGAGYAMAVVGSEGGLVAFEPLVSNGHCGDMVDGIYNLRLRWLVAPEDLLQVTTKRVTAEYSDGTKAELLAGVPLRAEGDGWIANADGVEVWVRLPTDAIGRYYDAGDRAFAEATREPISKGEDQLLYDRTRALSESRLLSTFLGDGVRVASFSREEKSGQTFAEVRTECAAIRVVVPASRAKADAEDALRHAGILGVIGSGGGSVFGGFAESEPPKPKWHVAAGTTAYWRDGSVGGLVEKERTFEAPLTEVAGRSCFGVQIMEGSRFDLCFDPKDVQETVGASPGELDVPTVGLLGAEIAAEIDGGLGGLGAGGVIGGVPGGTIGSGGASVPRTRSGAPEVTGAIDKDSVRRVVRRHIGEVRYCYEKGLTKDPTLAGSVTISFTIGPTGNVSSSSVKDDTLTDAAVGKCVAKAVKKWVFPAPIGGGLAVIRYPFTFSK